MCTALHWVVPPSSSSLTRAPPTPCMLHVTCEMHRTAFLAFITQIAMPETTLELRSRRGSVGFSARLSEQEVLSSILSDFKFCFDFPLIRVAIASGVDPGFFLGRDLPMRIGVADW